MSVTRTGSTGKGIATNLCYNIVALVVVAMLILSVIVVDNLTQSHHAQLGAIPKKTLGPALPPAHISAA